MSITSACLRRNVVERGRVLVVYVSRNERLHNAFHRRTFELLVMKFEGMLRGERMQRVLGAGKILLEKPSCALIIRGYKTLGRGKQKVVKHVTRPSSRDYKQSTGIHVGIE